MAIPDYIFQHMQEEKWVSDRQFDMLAATRKKSSARRKERRFADPDVGSTNHIIFNAGETTTVPDMPVLVDGNGMTLDLVCLHLAEQSKVIDEYNTLCLGRSGWGAKHNDHVCIANYDKDYNNAYFDGSKFTFGNGDGALFTSLAYGFDVHAHEYGHGYVQTTSGSRYFAESGALNEACADWFGITFQAMKEGWSIDKIQWYLGAGILGEQAKQNGWKGIRTFTTELAYPRDPQPKFNKDKKLGPTEMQDNFGVHIWSGIMNHAFYLYATGQDQITHLHEGIFQVFALSMEECGQFSGFKKFAQAAQSVCAKREPKTSKALENAFKVVQVIQ